MSRYGDSRFLGFLKLRKEEKLKRREIGEVIRLRADFYLLREKGSVNWRRSFPFIGLRVCIVSVGSTCQTRETFKKDGRTDSFYAVKTHRTCSFRMCNLQPNLPVFTLVVFWLLALPQSGNFGVKPKQIFCDKKNVCDPL